MQLGPPRKESPWRAIGCGVVRLVVLGLVVLLVLAAALFLYSWRHLRKVQRAESDPKMAEALVREFLDWSELPAGYRLAGVTSLPFMAASAVFTDLPPSAKVSMSHSSLGESFKDRGFIFLSTRVTGRPRELRDFVDGMAEQPVWPQVAADFEYGELIGRGSVAVNGATLPYSANRGWFDFDSQDRAGLITVLEIDCPDDEVIRMGVWFGPDPHQGKPVAESDYTGTSADPKEIAAFASHFRFCPES